MMVVIIFYPYFSSFKDFSVSLTILILLGLLYDGKVESSVKRFEMPSKEDYQRKAIIYAFSVAVHLGATVNVHM